MPFQLAGIGIEGNNGTSIEVVALALIAVAIRAWISDAPVCQVAVRIVGTCHPDRSSAVLPGIAVCRPSLMAGFARSGNGVKAPGFFPGLCIVCRDEAADAILATGGSNDNLVLHDQGRKRHG